MLSFSQKRPSELLLCQRFHRHLFVFRLLTILRVPAAAAAAAAKSLQSCQTLCDPTDSSPPSSPVPGILQARICHSSSRKLIHCARMNFMFVRTLYPEPSPPHNNLNLDIEPSSCCRLAFTLHKIYS